MSESEDNSYFFPYKGEIVNFVVPTTGIYRIEAWGARGGGNETAPKGAYSKSIVSLKEKEEIQILVGEKGYNGYNSGNTIYCSGGGGGSFVAKGDVPLCVAGGGGGNGYSSHDSVSSYACGQSEQFGGDPSNRKKPVTFGGYVGSDWSGGGGGFVYDGDNPTSSYASPGKGGISFLNGGSKQTVSPYKAYGGFGGGGSTHGRCGGSGGGGYTGGSGSANGGPQAGGGGSYYKGSIQDEESEAISGCDKFPPKPGSDDGNGYVVLTLISGNRNFFRKVQISYERNRLLWTIFPFLSPK